ncbi:AMP-binding protein [Motilimonas sp. 1_MG-2023]|uniref:AMP-binding protein n=1 Tax=Motilimonas sp. 1_MG-2023 TaxID=3062672 RepID=UPI0026E3D6EB|nr:AMP-binding protein [Motilimonas sp. 1_MG-2023]MDO6524522.1 AMP-binding protein [Motilimonas sp. 1_MG-2023]
MLVLDQIAHYATQTPTNIAVFGGAAERHDSDLTYSQLHQKIGLLAQQFSEQAIRHIGISLSNSWQWLVVELAAMQAGVTVTPIPPFFSEQQVKHLISQGQIKYVFVDKLAGGDDFPWANQVEEVWLEGTQTLKLADTDISLANMPANTCLITYTSGTTGAPKGVCISQQLIDQVCQNLMSVMQELEASQTLERHLCLLPLAVMLENIAGAFVTLCLGKSLVLVDQQQTGLSGSNGIDVPTLISCLTTFGPNSLILTPELLKLMLMLVASKAYQHQLHFIAVGGGHVPQAILQQAAGLNLPVYQGYGLSECGSVVALNTPSAQRFGSVGKPLPHIELSFSQSGEVCVKGATALGYLGAAGEPYQPFDGALIHTGDLGWLDDAGFLHLNGRQKNVQINSFGRNFSPEWIESEVNGLAGVRHCAIFGDGLPFITAVIALLPNVSQAQLATALVQLNQQLPDYAQIHHWLVATTPFSFENGLLTSNGRLRREQVWRVYQHDIAAVYSSSQYVSEN